MKSKAFLIRVAICFLLSLIPLSELENQIYSARLRLRGKSEHPSNILILNLEADDFKILKSRFSSPGTTSDPRVEPWQLKADRLEGLRDLYYWDPNLFREVFKKLLAQSPAAILMTWYIPNEIVESLTDPGIQLLARNRKIIWSAQFDSDGKFMRPPKTFGSPLSSISYGFNNLLSDTDGVVRRSVLFRESKPSLARVTESFFESSRQKPSSAESEATPFLINYAGPPGSIAFCKLSDIFNTAPSPECNQLNGKIILIARDSQRSSPEPLRESLSGAYFRTPLGDMSRAEVIAHEIHTLVNDKSIYRASIIEQTLLILAMIVGAAFYIIYYPVMISAIAITGTGLLILGLFFQFIFSLFDVYIPSANMGVAVLITYLVFTGYRLAFQENLQWRTLKQAQYLRELDQMKTNFLTLVSHDLKTPLAKIQAVTDRLKRSTSHLATEEKDLIDSLENSSSELRNYINSILNLSKIEAQKVILNKKSNDINRIIQQVLRRLRTIAQNKNITLEESLEPLFSVECDEDLIRQVLTNLVDNAIKYSPEHSKVIITSKEIEGFIQVDIQDFGPGIPKAQLPLMFRKFSRFLRPIHEQVKGTGLGLYLSKYFIEMHGGTIRVKSEEGKGTTFTFTLPLHGSESETLLG